MDLAVNETEQAFVDNGHGEYTMISPSDRLASLGETVVYGTSQDNGDTYILPNGKYLTKAYEDTYLLSDKINVNIDDFMSNTEVFNRYNVSNNLRDEMQSIILAQKALGNKELVIEAYAPSIDVRQPLGDEPLGTRYYTYYLNGTTYNLKDYSVKYSNLSTGMKQVKDTEALPAAKEFVYFLLYKTGEGLLEQLGAFSKLLSAYEVYKQACGTVTTAQRGDLLYTNLIWDKITKETYCEDPIGEYPNPGCVSYKVWLNRHDTYQYYASTGQSYLIKPVLNKTVYSDHFANPAAEAIQNGFASTYYDPWLYTYVYSSKIQLT